MKIEPPNDSLNPAFVARYEYQDRYLDCGLTAHEYHSVAIPCLLRHETVRWETQVETRRARRTLYGQSACFVGLF